MKKRIALILTAVVCLGFVLFGAFRKHRYFITSENYYRYLTIYVDSELNNDSDALSENEFAVNLHIEGVTDNLMYEDVEVEVRIYGTYWNEDLEKCSYETYLTVAPNVAGDGFATQILKTEKSMVAHKLFNLMWEVVSISGSCFFVG